MKGYRVVLFGIGAAFALLAGLASQAMAGTITCTLSACPPSCHPIFIDGGCTVGSFSRTAPFTMTSFTVTVGQAYEVTELVNGVPKEIGTVTFNSKGVGTYTALK
jgi:hypothetical protein